MIIDNEAAIRLLTFFCVLVLMLGLETQLPRRRVTQSRLLRWTTNFGVTLINTVLLRLLLPAAAVKVALDQQAAESGLFWLLGLPEPIGFVVGIILLDAVIYGQHVLFHRVPMLWRVHRMHHSDLEIDATTGVRFHPIEIILSMLIKIAVVWVFGIPAIAIIIFEVLLNATALFNHSNTNIPLELDAKLRRVIVTPDMHRVHHSIEQQETDSNFGFFLSCWDNWFKTYTPQPAAGHAGMTIGIPEFRDQSDIRLDQILIQPFVNGSTDEPEPEPERDTSYERFNLEQNRSTKTASAASANGQPKKKTKKAAKKSAKQKTKNSGDK
jgi:sterol desaturase/sphingolipid hydroxylase (fatty acid hydroxylase superfamily)